MRKIDELKKLLPLQRQQCLEKLFQKNKAYFAKTTPAIAHLLSTLGTEPYRIDINNEFLTIIDDRTGELCHPEVGLDRFSQALGDWTNNAWIDLVEGRLQQYADHGPYTQFPKRFMDDINRRFPGLQVRSALRKVNLPTIAGGKRFSNAVVFFGLFHGLHIDYYLSRTKVTTAMFVEPDKARFVLSCYFLDYAALAERFKGLLLHVGREFPAQLGDAFFRKAKISSLIWTRILPGYVSQDLDPFVSHLRLKWRAARDSWLPADWQLDGVHNSWANLAAGDPICVGPPSLSGDSRIVVVGAGPSLNNDLEWLKSVQDKVIIFAVHSAVSVLKQAGIRPDFQFSLDVSYYSKELWERLDLDTSVPIVTLVNDVPEKFKSFKDVLRLVKDSFAHAVRFNVEVPYLAPTTGNMALGFACWCKPGTIYLLGLDLGFRQASETHVSGSSVYQTEAEQRAALGSGFLEVASNFQGTDPVYTQPYFNLARMCAKAPIAKVAGRTKVYNCSDGALIEGAIPERSSAVDIASYEKKSEDITAIKEMFIPLKQGEHWQEYPLDGAEQLEAFKTAMLRLMKLKRFSWTDFVDNVDHFNFKLLKMVPRRVARNYDNRISPYLEVSLLLLDAWYRYLCFTNNEEEWDQVYAAGYEVFSKLVNEMVWDGH